MKKKYRAVIRVFPDGSIEGEHYETSSNFDAVWCKGNDSLSVLGAVWYCVEVESEDEDS